MFVGRPPAGARRTSKAPCKTALPAHYILRESASAPRPGAGGGWAAAPAWGVVEMVEPTRVAEAWAAVPAAAVRAFGHAWGTRQRLMPPAG